MCERSGLMQAEYIAKITGDTSGLERAVQKANGMTRKLENDEVLIKLDYDGNVKNFNKEFDKIVKACPELTVQFQYNVNQKMLDKELNKLKQLKELKMDVDTGSADKRIADMIASLESAVKNNAGSDIIESKIKGIYKYANSISDLGGKIKTDLENSIFDAVSGSKFEQTFEKLNDKIELKNLKLFNFKESIDKEISLSEKRIEEWQRFLTELESKGASKNGLTSELQDVQDEIKILRSDLSDMKEQLNSLSGENFQVMTENIKGVNEQLSIALEKIGKLTGESKLGSVINQWSNEEITKTNERFTAFNSKTLETSGVHVAADAEGVSEELIRSAISEMGNDADGFIHSHPNNIAAFSDKDIEAFYKLANEGIKKQVVASFQQTMSIDMNAVNLDKKDDVLEELRERYSEAENEVGTAFLKQNTLMVQEIANAIFDGNKTGNDGINKIIAEAKNAYNEGIQKIGANINLDDYLELIDNSLSDAFNNSEFAKNPNTKAFEKVKTFMGDLADSIVKSFADIPENSDALQARFQSILMDVFSNPDYLAKGVKSAVKVEDLSSFIDQTTLKQIGLLGGKVVVDGFREGIDAHSNSKEAERAIDDFANGVVDQFEKRISDMEGAAQKAGEAVSDAFNNSVNKDKLDDGDKISLTGFHGTSKKWNSNSFDFNETKASQLGSAMYFVDSPEKLKGFLSRPGSGDIKQTELNLEKCFILTQDYISSISDINKILGTTFDESSEAKEVLTAIRNYNKGSKENSENFRKSMLDMGYQGMYVGDYLANKKVKDELAVYDESLIQNLTSIPKAEFQSIIDGATEASTAIIKYSHSVKEASNQNNLSSGATTLPSQINEITQAENRMGNEAQEATDQARQGLAETTEEIKKQETELGRLVQYWGNVNNNSLKKGIEVNENAAYFNTKTGQVSSFVEGTSGHLSQAIIDEAYNQAQIAVNGAIHTHGDWAKAAFSVGDLKTAYNDVLRGIKTQILMSMDEVMTLDLNGVKGYDLKDIISEYESRSEQVKQKLLSEGIDDIDTLQVEFQRILKELFDSKGLSKHLRLVSREDWMKENPALKEFKPSLLSNETPVSTSESNQVADAISNQVDAMRKLESENEILQQQARATASAEQELMDAVDYWSHSGTTGIDNQTESMQRLGAENESLRQSLRVSADEMNHLNEEYSELQRDLEGEKDFSSSLWGDLYEQRQLTEELQAQNEELKERNKALENGNQPNGDIKSSFKDEQQVVDGVINQEATALSQLRDAINLVIDAVNEKTAAFKKEGAIVDQVIMNEELTALDVLSGYLVGLKRDVDAVTDSFKGIKLDVDMTNTDTNAVDKFVKSLSKLNEEKIDNNLIKVFVRLDDFAQAVNKIKIDDSSILASINNLLNKSKDLENLANALKENKKKIKEAAEEAEGKPKNYKEKYNSTLDDAITSTIRDIDYLEKKGKNTDAYFVKYKDYLEQLYDLSEKKLDFVSEDDYKQLMDLLDAIKAVRKEASLAINKETNAKSVQKYLGQVNDILSKNNNRKFKKTDEYKDLVELQGLLKSFDTSRPQSELDELGQKVLEVIARVKGLDESLKGGGFLSNFNHRLADMNAKFFAQYFSFQDIIRYAREAFNVIEDLNAQMVELAKVSEQSLKKIEGDFNSYASVAKDLGATISDTISATADWARMGYNVPDSQELARVALLYKNVGDGIDITSANQSLISTLQGYQMQADQAEHIVDVFNEVANNYAIDTAGIGEALQRSAASLNAANTSLEESVALVTAANTVVQNPESVGTTFKTLSARIRGAKTELSDLGEEEDEFTETTSKLRDLIKGLTGFDILEADEQTFKSIYDILVGIGKEWKNLSDIEQASLGEALAGKRNANTLYAILDNIDTLTNAYETAENAAGSAQREQENYEKGIEYSVNRAKAALQELAFDAINSDFLKGLIDFGTNAINLLDTIIDKFGLLKTAIIAIGTVWGTKNLG